MNVLMYHSVSRGEGPTNVPPDTFRRQIEILAECGYRAITLDEFGDWHAGSRELSGRSVLITFDDGFADFADSAFPILSQYGYAAVVFLPTGRIGGTEDWLGADGAAPRRLMSWPQVEDLARQKVEFGGHSVSHRDLTRLAPSELREEVQRCREEIEARIGRRPAAFAPPYGKAGEREREEIRRQFGLSLGTRLDRVTRGRDRYDLPRIEMHYFRNPARWRSYLEGSGDWYLSARRVFRNLRAMTEARALS